jgi:hypothetical protein
VRDGEDWGIFGEYVSGCCTITVGRSATVYKKNLFGESKGEYFFG